MAYYMTTYCGCWFPIPDQYGRARKQYLPQVDLQSHTTILSTTSRTVLRQVFVNTSDKKLDEVQYTFPLYDGVSVVGFKCTVATKTIVGVVKEKQQARAEYKAAVARGETAGLLEQLAEASDVFTTKIGNVPAGEKIHVEIIYLGELKHDAEADGTRFTVPTVIAPRYGSTSYDSAQTLKAPNANDKGGIKFLVDVALEEGSLIKGIQSPSHPIAITMGRTSSMHEDAFDNRHASATLALDSTELEKDFVIVVVSKGQEIPRALLETHPTIPNQRALMTTLVPKFNIPNIVPEIVFVVDRSGSMEGKIPTLVSAMKIFLKSLPVTGVKFNICSFGSSHSFLFDKSKTYDQSSLQEALQHLKRFGADFGGTEMLKPIKATVKNRYKDMPLEVMVLTDGEIWNHEEMFQFINEQKNARFFTLGIGHGASSALVEGIARAGNGFAQFVADNEKMDKRIVRMLRGALTPHITDYSLEVRYGKDESDKMSDDDDFEIVESFKESTKIVVTELKKPESQKKISLFNSSAEEEQPASTPVNRYAGLPKIDTPKVLQTPHKIPSLFPFNRTTVYLLLGPEACQRTPKSVILRGSSDHGPLELEIAVEDVGKGETIHQLAAKKAVHELEEGRGWITEAESDGVLIKSKYEGRWDLLVEREAVRLGVQFQVGGKWCSFVAVEKKSGNEAEERSEKNDDIVKMETQVDEQSRKSLFSSAPSGSGLFGATSTRAFGNITQGGALFGSSSTNKPSQVGGLFGTKPSQAGGLFGTNAPQAGGLFGTNAPQAGGLFGTNTPQVGGRFGNNASQAAVIYGTNTPHAAGLPGYNDPQVGSLFRGLAAPQSAAPVDSHTSISSAAKSIELFGGCFDTSTVAKPDSLFDATPPSYLASVSPAFSPVFAGSTTPSYDPTIEDSTDLTECEEADDFGSASERARADPSTITTTLAESQNFMANQSLDAGVSRCQPPGSSTSFLPGGLGMSYDAAQYGAAPPPPPAPSARMAQAPARMMASFGAPFLSRGGALGGPPPPQFLQAAPSVDLRRQDKSAAFSTPKAKKAASFFGGFGSNTSLRSRKTSNGLDGAVSKEAAEPEAKTEKKKQQQQQQTYANLSDDEKMHKLIEMQAFDGTWTASANLWKLLDAKADLVDALRADDKVKATAFAIAWLESKMAKEVDVWEMVVEKARAWLESQNGVDVEDLIAKAKTVLAS